MRRSDEGRMEKVSQRRLVEEDLPTKARWLFHVRASWGKAAWWRLHGEGSTQWRSGEEAPWRRQCEEGSNTWVGRVRRWLGFTKMSGKWERAPCPHALGIIYSL
jgi:hypothetical protein